MSTHLTFSPGTVTEGIVLWLMYDWHYLDLDSYWLLRLWLNKNTVCVCVCVCVGSEGGEGQTINFSAAIPVHSGEKKSFDCWLGTPFCLTKWNTGPKEELGDACSAANANLHWAASTKQLFLSLTPLVSFDKQTHTAQWHTLIIYFKHTCHTNDTALDVAKLVLIKLTAFISNLSDLFWIADSNEHQTDLCDKLTVR
jgi:hypothetical protein